MTSGAIQNGVPTNVNRFIVSVSCPATPKSANLTSPLSDSKMLAAGGEICDFWASYDVVITLNVSVELSF